MDAGRLKVFIAGENTLVRKGFVLMLKTFSRINAIRDAEDGRTLLKLIESDVPHVVLLDIDRSCTISFDTIGQITSRYPFVKVMVLTQHSNENLIIRVIEMGAHGCILKNTEPRDLELAIYDVLEKNFYHNEIVVNALRNRTRKIGLSPLGRLSTREIDILNMLCHELSAREIGEALFISEKTVHSHRLRILEKLAIKGTVGLVRFAYDNGLMIPQVLDQPINSTLIEKD